MLSCGSSANLSFASRNVRWNRGAAYCLSGKGMTTDGSPPPGRFDGSGRHCLFLYGDRGKTMLEVGVEPTSP